MNAHCRAATSGVAHCPLVRLTDVGKTFRHHDGGETVALYGVTLEIAAGCILGVLGESDAGKSTLLQLVAGLYGPSSGHIVVDGVGVTVGGHKDWRSATTTLGAHEAFEVDCTMFDMVAHAANGMAAEGRSATVKTRPALRAQFGLYLPVLKRLTAYLLNPIHLILRFPPHSNIPVPELIQQRLPC